MNHRDRTSDRVSGIKRKSGLIAAVGGLALIMAGLPACGPNDGQGGGQKAGQSTVQPASPKQKPGQQQKAGPIGKKHRLSPKELKQQ